MNAQRWALSPFADPDAPLPICPECKQADETGVTVPSVVGGVVPRWDDDATVVSRGWTVGRCGLCGLRVTR